MVCERPGARTIRREGRIQLVRDGEWLNADGTTLGADDGVAIAAMMALAEDYVAAARATAVADDGRRGGWPRRGQRPRRVLIDGRILVNLDSEEDGTLTVGCAGGTDTWVRVARPRSALEAGETCLVVTVSGGLGGHSGVQIHLGRSNAIKVLGHAVREAYDAVPFRLVSLTGGKSRNAIPRDAAAVIALPEADTGALSRCGGQGGGDGRRRLLEDRPGHHRHARRGGRGGRRLEGAQGHALAPRRACRGPNRAARHESRLRGPRRNQHVAG